MRGNSGLDFSFFEDREQCHSGNFEPVLCAYNLSVSDILKAQQDSAWRPCFMAWVSIFRNLNFKSVHESGHLPFRYFIGRAPPLADDHFDIVQKRSIWTDADHPPIRKDCPISHHQYPRNLIQRNIVIGLEGLSVGGDRRYERRGHFLRLLVVLKCIPKCSHGF